MKQKIIICVNYRSNPNQPSCALRGSEAIAQCLEREIAERGLPASVERFYCLGYCEKGPNLRLAPEGGFFHQFEIGDIPQLLAKVALAAKE
jgi:NADH:ubiquinone oxidoreductase subunit E